LKLPVNRSCDICVDVDSSIFWPVS